MKIFRTYHGPGKQTSGITMHTLRQFLPVPISTEVITKDRAPWCTALMVTTDGDLIFEDINGRQHTIASGTLTVGYWYEISPAKILSTNAAVLLLGGPSN